MRACLLLVLLAPLPASAGERGPSLFERWERAGPDERRQLGILLEDLDRAQRFASARPVLVDFGGRTWSLADLFTRILEPALRSPAHARNANESGLAGIHRDALAALRALRAVYAAPRPVRPGTLNLLLGYAHRTLVARALDPQVRMRFFVETVRNIRDLEDRVRPDARAAWLIHTRLIPALTGLARRHAGDARVREAIFEAASLLNLPSILDERAQARLAPLASGVHSLAVLMRFYRRGMLDAEGRAALARSVRLQARDDAAFLSGAAPLLLELLLDDRLSDAERGALADLVLEKMAPDEFLRDSARDLLAAALGGPPRSLERFAEERARRKGALALPEAPARRHRFLCVVLLQESDSAPPVVARVIRADLPLYRVVRTGNDSRRPRFAGVLLPAAGGDGVDFVGPPPGLTGARDNRLLRRELRLERISVHTFGTRGEEIELCAALPEDASEPVPSTGADLHDVLALVRARLRLSRDPSERSALVGLLVRIGTDEARTAAVEHADTAASLAAILPLAEAGHARALERVLGGLALLDGAGRERALLAAVSGSDPARLARVRKLCEEKDPGIAVPAADALLFAGEASGFLALLRHPDVYARACGAALALRTTELAGGLRVEVEGAPPPAELAALAQRAFTAADGEVWTGFGRWLGIALRDAKEVRRLRYEHQELYLGRRAVRPGEFARAYTEGFRAGKEPRLVPMLMRFLLSPVDPGRGILRRDLDPLLDVLERKAASDAGLRRVWIDALVALTVAQSGMERETGMLELAHERLSRMAGGNVPAGARHKAGLYWPLWAARRASG